MSTCECGCGKSVKTPGRRFAAGCYPRVHPPNKRAIEYQERDCGHDTPCWIWTGRPNSSGYGRVTINGERDYAHRVYYRRYKGSIPDGLTIDHLCRNRLCVNPDHLEAVPERVNIRRGAHVTLTEDQVAAIRASNEPQIALADRFGVAACTISNIKAGRSWSEVKP